MPTRTIRTTMSGLAVVMACTVLPGRSPSAQPADLAFLGPRGTYSEQAALAVQAARSAPSAPTPEETLGAVVDAVAGGRARLGILPIAATVSSFPAAAHAALLRAPDPGWRVVGEVQLPIVSHLLVRPGTRREDLRRVLSHPNALREAGVALRRDFGDLQQVETASTAAAAREVAASDGTIAAVAGPAAAPLFGLVPLAEGIQDDPHNTTLFWVIGPAASSPAEAPNRLVLIVDAAGGSGAFGDAVTALTGLGFRVSFVNSAPLPGPPFAFRYALAATAPTSVSLARVRAALATVPHTLVGAYAVP
ncbi:prephenate dehydratase domain-containing protein (plasmid) [Roseomonas sp. CCTCC AB2023176]|uniref:prephenate dehydratase domain-containing protein n=1 Tax=Roseomonas sp. CCTCC AB2023176 TaxID=3342640 RepID=UPI0035DF157F